MRYLVSAIKRVQSPSTRWSSTVAVTRNVIDTLEERGFVSALTHPELRTHVSSRTCIYGGVDPSASSLHVGNLVALMGLLHFRLAGHDVLALIGGATGSIGDPSGRSTERTALEPEVLQRNIQGITNQVHRFFERGDAYVKRQSDLDASAGSVTVVNNHDWHKDVTFLDFLRDVGKLAKVNTMIARDSVKSRLNTENGISFTEFSYQLLQAYDFVHLHRHHNCRIQLGGSDQWGNIVAGIDLIKRQSPVGRRDEPAYGLTLPLLTTETGEKFGKSAGNAVWLDGDQTSVHDFYQFFYRLPDVSVEQQLKLFTLLPIPRIKEIMQEHESAREKRVAQKILAEQVTELVHGHEALQQSLTSARLLYRVPLHELTSATALEQLAHEPFFKRVTWDVVEGTPVTKLLTLHDLAKSGKEAARLITSKGVTVSGRVVEDPREVLKRTDVVDDHLVVIKSGKKGNLILYVE